MKRKQWFVMMMVLLCSLTLIFAGCGGDDDDDDNNNNNNGDDDVEVTENTGDEVQLCDFMGLVRDFAQPQFLEGMTVYILDNDTGQKLADYEGKVTAADGSYEFNQIPCGKYGFLVEGNKDIENKTVDTYQFEIQADAQDEIIWSVDELTYGAAPAMAGVTLEAGKGIAAGAVYWVDEEETELPVGCATVTTDPASTDIRYFSDDQLPTTLDVQAGINTLNGFYLAPNLPASTTGEEVIITAHYGGEDIGTVRFVTFPDAICIGNIYVVDSYTANPSDESGNCVAAE